MNGFQKRTRAKMDQIEQCAMELLRLPVQDIAVAEIAKQAQVSQVTIYNYYGSKDALLTAALKRLFHKSAEEFRALVGCSAPFDEKLKRMILMKRESSGRIHPDTYTKLITDNEEMHAYIQMFSQEQTIPLFLDLIREGRALGKVRSQLNEVALLSYLNVLSQAVALFSNEMKHQLGRPGGTEEMIDLFLYGILNQE